MVWFGSVIFLWNPIFVLPKDQSRDSWRFRLIQFYCSIWSISAVSPKFAPFLDLILNPEHPPIALQTPPRSDNRPSSATWTQPFPPIFQACQSFLFFFVKGIQGWWKRKRKKETREKNEFVLNTNLGGITGRLIRKWRSRLWAEARFESCLQFHTNGLVGKINCFWPKIVSDSQWHLMMAHNNVCSISPFWGYV